MPDNVTKLTGDLRRVIRDTRAMRYRYTTHETLEALMRISAEMIYHCADGQGATLDQFCGEVPRSRMCIYPRDDSHNV